MRFPILPVLGALLSVAVFGPFVLMFAGYVWMGDSDVFQLGLFLLVHVNPLVIPALLGLLGVTWAFQQWMALPTAPVAPAASVAACAPRAPDRVFPPVAAAPAWRPVERRDEVIDVVAMRAGARPATHGGHRVPAQPSRLPAMSLETARPLRLR